MSKLSLKITQASLNQTALDWPRNMANIYAAIDEAVSRGSDILALEELALTGYEVNDDFQRTDNDRILAALDDISTYAQATDPNLIISIGHPWRVQMRDLPAEPGFGADRVKYPLYDRMSKPFNVQSIVSGGQIHAMTAKANLYNDGRGYESRYFNEWSMSAAKQLGGVFGTIQIPIDETGRNIQFGNPILAVSDGVQSINIAQAICETKWVATKYDGQPYDDSRYADDNIIPYFSRHLGSKDGLVLLIPNASPPARDKIDKHVHLNKLAAQYADAVVDTDGLGSSGSTFAQFGHRMIVQDGDVLSYGRRMSFDRVSAITTIVAVTPAPLNTAAKVHLSLKHEFKNAGAVPAPNRAYENEGKQSWDNPANTDRHYEEVLRYTAFWLFDYMRKSGSRGIMEALSGGADSAFNSAMVSVMVHLGMDELGVGKFCDELNLRNKAQILDAEKTGGKEAAIKVCLAEMLTCVYMGTGNSSKKTLDAARFLIEGGVDPVTGETVEGLGGKFIYRDVQELLDFYGTLYAVESLKTMGPVKKQRMVLEIAGYLNASPHTTTPAERAAQAAGLKARYPQIKDLVTAADGMPYENIQARGREVLIMLFANKEGKMAVANPNLDEARNAYSTFGGDLHSGTINLNAHMPKAYQLQVMQYLCDHGLQGVMEPVRSLQAVLRNKPTAELLPRGADGQVIQNDEDALQRNFWQMDQISDYMHYARKMTGDGERRMNAEEIFASCRQDRLFQNADDNRLYNMVRVSYARWALGQHKIHASPIGPTFGFNVDHQTSMRTPNLSGQSKDELTLLGLDLMFRWAEEDQAGWTEGQRQTLNRRAWQDTTFVKTFEQKLRSRVEGRDYDLHSVYAEVLRDGWDKHFAPLSSAHPIRVLSR
ncbi:MAG: hypothetical protein JWO78_398 [Micavibrio sp.]|nr:hypothetical protein [Micavibrio sp.]